MAANERALKTRIKSVTALRKVTNAMYLISYSALQRRRDQADRAAEVRRELESLSAVFPGETAPAAENSVADPNTILLVFSGERGLAGAYYRELGTAADQFLSSHPKAQLFRIGPYSVFSAGKEIPVWPEADGMKYPLCAADAQRLAENLLKRKEQRFFLLAGSGQPEALRFLEAKKQTRRERRESTAPIGAESVRESAELFLLANQIYETGLRASCAELKSRMLSMNTATDNADDLLHTLQLEMQNVRQERITEELTELTAGATAHRKTMSREVAT